MNKFETLKNKGTVFAGVVCASYLTSENEARTFLEILSSSAPDIVPRKWGNWEPLRHDFSRDQIGAIATEWRDPFLWKAQRGKQSGGVSFGAPKFQKPAHVSLECRSPVASGDGIVRFVERIVAQFGARFAYVHRLVPSDLERGSDLGIVTPLRLDGSEVYLGVFDGHIQKHLPDLFWWNYLGPEYQPLLAPAEREEPHLIAARGDLGGGSVIQLGKSLFDDADSIATFEIERIRIKKLINADLFFDVNKGESRPYSAPRFESPAHSI